MNKILKKWNTENANKIDSITGLEGYIRKEMEYIICTIIYTVIAVYRSRGVEIVVVIIGADLYILIKNFYFGKILIRKMQRKNTF